MLRALDNILKEYHEQQSKKKEKEAL